MPLVTTQIGAPTQSAEVSQQYTPPNWGSQPALYSLLIKDTNPAAPVTENEDGSFTMKTNVTGSTVTLFVFDGIREAQHEQSCVPTQHPLQTGFNVADHAVLQPAHIVLHVIMSDAMAAYSSKMWSGNPSKSVSAFQQMITLMQNRALITVNTRLKTYANCLLINVSSSDNKRHYYGADMTLTFQQLIIADLATQVNSARSQTSASTALGSVQPMNPAQGIIDQHTDTETTSIPGAGQLSSNIVPAGGGA